MSSKKLNPFKDFQLDQIQRSSGKIFTAHYACRNAALNLTPVTGTTNEFIFQIINSLIESWGVCLTCLDCKRQPRWQDGQKILIKCPDWITSLWTLLLWKTHQLSCQDWMSVWVTCTWKQKRCISIQLVCTSEQTFAIPGEEGCVPLLHNPPWTWLHIENLDIIWYHYLIL